MAARASPSRPAAVAGGCCSAVLLAAALLFSAPSTADAYDSLDPHGNITIKWDVMQWTPDGYVAVVTLFNYQQFRHIQPPGWQLGWTWAEKEVIRSMRGALAVEQSDCSVFRINNGSAPHSCKRDPTVVDLLPGVPDDMRVANCCRAGSLSASSQDPANAAASFQITVGLAGSSNSTVRLPRNFSLGAPGPGYTCGRAVVVRPSMFFSQDGRRVTQALMTWDVICTYSQFLASKVPSCCVLSSFDSDKTANCPTCSCGCRNDNATTGKCVKKNAPDLQSIINGPGRWTWEPLLQCTPHMCPVQINWHLEHKDKEHWRVKITVTNLNYRMNHSEWNLVFQPLNSDITKISGFNYKSILPYGIDDTGMIWGVKPYNDLLMQAGPLGDVQGELIVRKNLMASSTAADKQRWAFPSRVYFNGDNCVMPPPDGYPPARQKFDIEACAEDLAGNRGLEMRGEKGEPWTEVLSWEPRAFLYHNFLSKEECEYLISLARPLMKKSTVVDTSTGGSKDSRVRTSSGMFLRRGLDKIISTIEKRISDYTFIPVENGEGLQVLHYEVGQKYEPHFDYFHDEFNTKNGGQRIATLLMYLSDVEEGGETVFPTSKANSSSSPFYNELSECAKRGLSVKPKMGDALLFWSMRPDGSLDPSSLHGEVPIYCFAQMITPQHDDISIYLQFPLGGCPVIKG
uniref:procollagen-proline 4-dioxygenase n=1 Tax=Oryza brachyantha TaxID=4533 RepID=J3N3S1_ORYBR